MKDVELALKQAGKNRVELEKSISYFKNTGDSLKLKALYFLVANMDIHSSASYYWADSLNKRIPFNELAYRDFESTLTAFDSLKKEYKKIHPVAVSYRDIDTVKSDLLIENVDQSFLAWKGFTPQVTFEDFCEYVLPYRISVEPVQNWRKIYNERYSAIKDSISSDSTFRICSIVKRDIKDWFVNTYGIEERTEPLPRLGSLQLLHREKGNCEDIAGLTVFALRSIGVPVSEDISVYWGTSTGSHFWNVAFGDGGKAIPFDVSNPALGEYHLAREPSKVIRLTYSKQRNTVAHKFPSSHIPDGFMRTMNYMDVTDKYWNVYDLSCSLHPQLKHEKVVFACVFNNRKWQPAWWANVTGKTSVFGKMPAGVVFLPMDYRNDKLIPAGYPVSLNRDGSTHELRPDLGHKRSITIKEQEKYLLYRPGKKYTLYYWRNKWIKVGEKIPVLKELVFNDVPANALLLLVPEYSKRKERPFTIDEKGERVWW